MARPFSSSSIATVLLSVWVSLGLACSGQATDGVEGTSTGGAEPTGGSSGMAVGGNAGSGGSATAGGGSGGAVSGTGGAPQGTGGAASNCEDFVPDECGSCSCTDGQIVCTDVYCPPPQCQDGATMDDGCNTCTCSQGGWLCTTRACLAPACDDGQTQEQDCNTCVCESGAWSCTERACEPKACGARAGDTCTADEYCAYQAGDYCGAADAEATCLPRPDACDTVYAPVCGCDGKTYGNACEAAVAGSGVNTDGACP